MIGQAESLILMLLLAYVVGAIPNGLWIGKVYNGTDLREHGSKNIGATNAYRVLGKKIGFLVLLADITKGLFGVWIAQVMLGTPLAQLAGGLMAMIGHNWSLFLKFKGGKGVATGLGVLMMIAPIVTALVFSIWLVIVWLTGYVSLGSIIAAVSVPCFMVLFGAEQEFVLFGLIAALFVVFRHKANIGRLLKGEELKVGRGSDKK